MTHLMTRIQGPPIRGGYAWSAEHAATIRAAGLGDVIAQERLWRSHVDLVYRVCAAQLPASDAEDVVTETFLAAFASATSFDPERGSVRSWLLGIAVNQIRRRWRSDRRIAATLDRLRSARESTSLQPTVQLAPTACCGSVRRSASRTISRRRIRKRHEHQCERGNRHAERRHRHHQHRSIAPRTASDDDRARAPTYATALRI